MDIRVFKTFIAVADFKHFGRAAETLYITQAAVSARIKQLEEFYTTQLIVREKNNLRLTPSGEALLSHAHLMVSQMEQSKLSISITNQRKSSFRIAATPNVWDAFFSRQIDETIQLFHQTIIGAEISVREAIQRNLMDRSLDVGLLTDPIKDDDFVNELISYFDLSLVGTHPNFDKNVEDYIFVDWGITFQKEHALYHKVQPSFKTTTAIIALEIILAKGGFAYLPTKMTHELVSANTLIEIEAPVQIKRPIYLAYRKSTKNIELINQLRHLLTKSQ